MEDNFEKLKLEVQASEKGINSILEELNAGLESLGTEIETLNVSVETTDEKVGSLEKQAQELNSELTQLKQEHQNLDQEVEDKEKEQKTIQEELEELQHEKNSLESDIANKEGTLSELQAAVSNLEEQISVIKDKLLNAEDLKEEKVGTIEKEVAEYKHKIETKQNHYRVLQHFLETEYEQEPRYDVVKVLNQSGVGDIETLARASGVGKATVEDTLKELEQKNVLSLDGQKFTLEKEIRV